MSRSSRPGGPAGAGTPSRSAAVRASVPVTLDGPGGPAARLVTFNGLPDPGEHLACLLPGVRPAGAPLVRLHSECLTGDVLGSTRCDCGPQLAEALGRIGAEGGAVLYLRQEGRGIGLYPKLDAYLLQDGGVDTFDANRLLGYGDDHRDYRVAAVMLHALGMTRVRLLTNNPDKVRQLREHGIDVVEVLPTAVHLTTHNARYLAAKAVRAGHHLPLPPEGTA
ncbi:GTP cyclohydrolase II [Pilimelia columellifera]|uniref:GTP cyclohydrolase-2 n=1 Tax=Pilimelia columellifera subsp. columellifera TaxID=706583 RepID=A0ABN3MZP5_9ACTN